MSQIRTWRIFVLLTIFGMVLSANIITSLPELNKTEHSFPSENFTVRHKEHFVYNFGPFENPEISITNKKGADAQSSCHSRQQQLVIRPVQSFDFSSASLDEMSFSQGSIAVSHRQKLVYFLTSKMKLTAFSFNQTHLTRLAAQTLNATLKPQQDNTSGSGALVASQDGTYVFAFTPYGVFRVDCKGIVSNIEKLSTPHFKEFNYHVSEALVHGEWIVVGCPAVGVFAYHVDVTGALNLVRHIESFEDRVQIHPGSIAIDKVSGLVYILDQVKNIYVFQIHNGKLDAYDVISFSHQGNFKLGVSGSHILYSFYENQNFMICQLFYDPIIKQAELLRYYKLFDFITDFFVFEQSMLVFSQDTLDWFPIGIDPRLISKQHNGVRVQSNVNKVVPLSDKLYLFSNGKTLELSWVIVKPPQIQCNFDKKHSEITIKTESKISSCGMGEALLEGVTKKGRYNNYCELHKTLYIDIDIPEKHERQKIVMYGVISLFVVTVLIGLVCLIQWRNNRIKTIDWFNDQIRKYQQSKTMTHKALNQQADPRDQDPFDIQGQPQQPPVLVSQQNQQPLPPQPSSSSTANI